MSIEHITDYETRGPQELLLRYRKPRNVAMLVSWLGELQELEDAFWVLLGKRTVADAVGAELDLIGRIVDQPREGRPDEIYRVWVAARILVLRSSGQTEQLIEIAKRLVGDAVPVYLEEYYPLAMIIRAEAGIDPTRGAQIAKLLSAAKGGGVALQFEWFPSGTTPPFTLAPGAVSVFDSPMGFDNGILAAVSNGNEVEFWTSGAPETALLDDGDELPLVFDGDNDFLILG